MVQDNAICQKFPLNQPQENGNKKEISLRTKPVFLGKVPATTKDYYRAAAVTAALIIAFLITIPEARKQLPAYPTLIVVYDAFVLMLDLITAFLLFTQVAHVRERSLVVMGCGYLFTTVLIGAHGVSFPDAFRQGTLIGGSQTTAWFWMGWHGLFPFFVGAYALLRYREAKGGKGGYGYSRKAVWVSVAVTILLAITAILLASRAEQLLPKLMEGNRYESALTPLILATGWIAHLIALIILVWCTRLRRLIDLYLAITLLALVIDLALSAVFISGRYELGFYLGRVYGLLAGCFVLSLLLRQTFSLYAKAVHLSQLLLESEEQLKGFNVTLESKVESRTLELRERKDELQKKNRQLQDTIAQLESFNYIASHDLQEPLRKIQTFADLLLQQSHGEGTSGDFVRKIHASSLRMSELIAGLFKYSGLSETEGDFELTDLNSVLENVKADLEIKIKETGAQIESDKLPSVRAIPSQMHQVFSNLITNALKFSDKPPKIRITTTLVKGKDIDSKKVDGGLDEEAFVALSFSDNGIGFDNRYSERIFQLCHQLHPREKYAGTGIGLSIVEKIVRRHNGFVTAYSEKGNGATFVVYLPGQ
jgi:signal transduction histidine kinase